MNLEIMETLETMKAIEIMKAMEAMETMKALETLEAMKAMEILKTREIMEMECNIYNDFNTFVIEINFSCRVPRIVKRLYNNTPLYTTKDT